MEIYNNTSALYHHGIKGQRWGVRRYQNRDGTLTDKGRKRQRSSDSAQTSDDTGNNHKSSKSKSNLRDLSDDDVKKAIARLQLEQQYKELSAKQVSRGMQNTKDILSIIGSTVAITSSAVGIVSAISKLQGR